MKLSPVFGPEETPTRSGLYLATETSTYSEAEREIIQSGMSHLLFTHNYKYYSILIGMWFPFKGLCFPLTNQKLYWFGLVKE